MKNFGAFKGLLLLVLSFVVFTIVSIIGVVYSFFKHALKLQLKKLWYSFGDRFTKLALLYDQKGNIQLGDILNDVYVKKDVPEELNGIRLRYGHQDDTISDMTGRLALAGFLSKEGIAFKEDINRIFKWLMKQEDHCIESVSEENRKRILNKK